MDLNMSSLTTPAENLDPLLIKIQGAKYEEKWEILRPRMQELFPDRTLKEIQQEMSVAYGFFAKYDGHVLSRMTRVSDDILSAMLNTSITSRNGA